MAERGPPTEKSREQRLHELDFRTVTIKEVLDIFVTEPAQVTAGAGLKEAVDALAESNSQKVYVVDEAGILMGTVSISTLMRQLGYRVGARAPGVLSFIRFLTEIAEDSIEDFTKKATPAHLSSRLLDAIAVMVEDNLHDLPVVDAEGKLIGELRGLHLVEVMRGVL